MKLSTAQLLSLGHLNLWERDHTQTPLLLLPAPSLFRDTENSRDRPIGACSYYSFYATKLLMLYLGHSVII